MRKAALLLATPFLAAGAIVATPTAASADTETCVHRAEFQKVTRGMHKSTVHAIFDVKGKQQSIYVGYDGTRYESRSYRGCANRYSSVHISYTNKRVDSKYAYWG